MAIRYRTTKRRVPLRRKRVMEDKMNRRLKASFTKLIMNLEVNKDNYTVDGVINKLEEFRDKHFAKE